jgi:hypothetical protein
MLYALDTDIVVFAGCPSLPGKPHHLCYDCLRHTQVVYRYEKERARRSHPYHMDSVVSSIPIRKQGDVEMERPHPASRQRHNQTVHGHFCGLLSQYQFGEAS